MQFIVRRLGFYVVAAWVALTINFLIPHVLPGTPVEAMLAQHPQLTASAVKALDLQFGVGHQGSLLHQYGVYLGHLIHGNLGVSTAAYPATVTSVLGNTIPWTIALVGTATIISFVLGTVLGILAGWRRGGRFDQLLPAFTFLQATPYFFLALLAIQLFANDWHIFPATAGPRSASRSASTGRSSAARMHHSLLPALTIIVTSMAGWMLQMRNVMITTIGEDYVLAAEAKGLSHAPRDVHLRGAQRDPPEHRRFRARDRLRRRRRARHGDRLLLPGRRLPALQRGHPG